jgi:hypothetical protein
VLPGLEVSVELGLGFYSLAFLLLKVTAFAHRDLGTIDDKLIAEILRLDGYLLPRQPAISIAGV